MTFVQAPKLLLGLVLILTVVPKVLSKVENGFGRRRLKRGLSRSSPITGLRLTANSGASGDWSTPLRATAGYEF